MVVVAKLFKGTEVYVKKPIKAPVKVVKVDLEVQKMEPVLATNCKKNIIFQIDSHTVSGLGRRAKVYRLRDIFKRRQYLLCIDLSKVQRPYEKKRRNLPEKVARVVILDNSLLFREVLLLDNSAGLLILRNRVQNMDAFVVQLLGESYNRPPLPRWLPVADILVGLCFGGVSTSVVSE